MILAVKVKGNLLQKRQRNCSNAQKNEFASLAHTVTQTIRLPPEGVVFPLKAKYDSLAESLEVIEGTVPPDALDERGNIADEDYDEVVVEHDRLPKDVAMQEDGTFFRRRAD